jgi:uncharacterized protein YkwD
MRLAAALVITAALGLAASPALGGARINKLVPCANAYAYFTSPDAKSNFRDGVLCLINAIRKSQHLPALKRDARLESVAQVQATKFARTGHGSHGKTLAEIGKRFDKKGYHPAAYDEAFMFGAPDPYTELADAMGSRLQCSQILDPRFRDVGIGVDRNLLTTVAVEFGLKRGAKQPSTDYKRAASCPHALPKPVYKDPPVQFHGDPQSDGSTVKLPLACEGPADCVITKVVATLVHVNKSVTLPDQTLAAGNVTTIEASEFAPADVQAEMAGDWFPRVIVSFSVTKPMVYKDVLEQYLVKPQN